MEPGTQRHVVMDCGRGIFAGSNTASAVAEREGRHWLGFEMELEYVAASAFRFIDSETPSATMRDMYSRSCAARKSM